MNSDINLQATTADIATPKPPSAELVKQGQQMQPVQRGQQGRAENEHTAGQPTGAVSGGKKGNGRRECPWRYVPG